MEVISFKFDKPWYRQTEMLVMLSMSPACIKRYMLEVQKDGGDLADMGYMKFDGFKEACWNPVLLLQWIVENKLEVIPRYDYELAEQKRTQMNVINLKKQQQHLRKEKI